MDNKRLVKVFYETIFSNGMVDRVGELISSDCVFRDGKKVTHAGAEGMRQHIIDVRKTYPDLVIKIIRQHEDGDFVISEIIAEGTHEGEWLGMKPTGKKLRFTGVDIDRVINGKIVEHGGAINTFETLFEQKLIRPTQ